MCTTHCKCSADNCRTWAICAHSDGPAGVQETAAFTTTPTIGTLAKIVWPGLSHHNIMSVPVLTAEIQGCYRDRGGWCFTVRVVAPLWTATSWTRQCQDHSCAPSLPRSLVWFSAGLHALCHLPMANPMNAMPAIGVLG
jgi:hypothetical protein